MSWIVKRISVGSPTYHTAWTAESVRRLVGKFTYKKKGDPYSSRAEVAELNDTDLNFTSMEIVGDKLQARST